MCQECQKKEEWIDLPEVLYRIFVNGKVQDYDQDEEGKSD